MYTNPPTPIHPQNPKNPTYQPTHKILVGIAANNPANRTSSSNTFIIWRPRPRLSEEPRLGEATILATRLEASMRTHGIRPRFRGDKGLPAPLTTTSYYAPRDSSIVIIFLDQIYPWRSVPRAAGVRRDAKRGLRTRKALGMWPTITLGRSRVAQTS
eukprot:COSAG05_NODE_43_length_25931_cov_49.314636_19_plen_157_part_00